MIYIVHQDLLHRFGLHLIKQFMNNVKDGEWSFTARLSIISDKTYPFYFKSTQVSNHTNTKWKEGN